MDLILYLSVHAGLVWLIFIAIQCYVVNWQILVVLNPIDWCTLAVVPIVIV